MYIDESGISNLANDSKYFVLSSIIVEDKVDGDLSAYLRHLKRRYSFKQDVSLHAFDLFEKKDHELYISDNKKCKEFTASIAEFIENTPFKASVLYLDKDELRKKLKAPSGYSFKGSKKHKADKELAYEILARKLIFTFAHILKKEKAIGSIVAESRRGADAVLLNTYLDTQDPQVFIKSPRIKKQAEISRDRIHSICFAGKKSLKESLELVDIVSYCGYNELVKRFPTHRSDSRGIKRMWERIKKRIEKTSPQKISGNEMMAIAKDRIDETSNRIRSRLAEFRDLVNPT